MAVALVVFGIIFMIFGLPLALILLVHRYYIGSFRTLLPEGSPPTVTEGNRLLGALSFFSERWEFLRLWQLESSTGNFGFYVGRKCVIALSGDAGRKWFLDARELSFSQGYGLLFGEKKDKIDGDGSFEKLFPACLARVLRRDALIKVLPYLTRDTRVHLLALAKSSTRITDPFETMYNLVFQITARTVACHEVADDPKLTATVRQAIKLLHSAASPIFVLFPWIPTPSTMRRYFAGIRVWWILRKIIKKKRSNKRPVDLDTDQADALAYLLEESHSEIAVIRIVTGSMIVGLLNSGIQAAWVLIYLGMHPEWLGKIRKEVVAAVEICSPDRHLPFLNRLSQLSFHDWETRFPLIELCLRESIRIQTSGCLFRKNTSGKDLKFGQEKIPAGCFVAYHLRDIHHNPDVYPKPDEWDPDRYGPGPAAFKEKPHGYVGWGAGRYPCLGMRFAKLENAIITAFFVSMFDFEVTNELGKPLRQLPRSNVNDSVTTPPLDPIRLKYRLRQGAALQG